MHEPAHYLVERTAIALYYSLDSATMWRNIFNDAAFLMDRVFLIEKDAAPVAVLKSLINVFSTENNR